MSAFRDRLANIAENLKLDSPIPIVWVNGRGYIYEGGGKYAKFLHQAVWTLCGVMPDDQVCGKVVAVDLDRGFLNCNLGGPKLTDQLERQYRVNLLLEEKDLVWVC